MGKKKVKYHYDPTKLEYVKVQSSIWKRVLWGLLFLAVSAVFGVLFNLFLSQFSVSPREKLLNRELNKMALQYEILQSRAKKMQVVLNYLKDKDEHIYRVIFEAEPVTDELKQTETRQQDSYSDLEGYYNTALLKRTTKTIDELARKVYVQSKSFDQLQNAMKQRVKMLSSIPGIQPVDNRRLKGMISGFGYRIHPIYKIVKMHTGLDFSAPTGTPIYATGDGYVAQAAPDRSYGNCVILSHGYGYASLYAHMSRFKVRRGQKINRGDLIGYVGSTGTSTGPHLHYEVIKNGKKVNPINFFYNDLKPSEYKAMLEASQKSNQSFD